MTSNLSHVLSQLSTHYQTLGKLPRALLMATGVLMLTGATALALRPAPLPDLSQGHHLRKADFYTLWNKGELVVLMRHAERCDQSTRPCLAQADGITVKGSEVAHQIGQAFQTLGLDNARIYNSPVLRTEQTAMYAFNRITSNEEWLANCRNSILNDVLQHKENGHNLILVTHSECIDEMEKLLGANDSAPIPFATSLIVSVSPDNHGAKVLGYVDAQDWGKVISKRPKTF